KEPLVTHLEARTDADVMARSADQLAGDLEHLFWDLLAMHAAWKVTAHAFQAKTALLHLALRHEDRMVERQCLRELARLQGELPSAEAAYERCLRQLGRHWQSLLKYRLPDQLHDALGAIAVAEGRSPLCQITHFLQTAVDMWHAQRGQA